MRTLALAQEWRRRGGDFLYAGRIASEALVERIGKEGGGVSLLQGAPDRRRDRAAARAQAGEGGWAVLDGYDFDAEDEKDLQSAGCRVLTLDDDRTRTAFAADVLLNQNTSADRVAYDTGRETAVLRSPRYALLRASFRERPGQPTAARDGGVLVLFGGSDAAGLTGRILSSLASLEDPPPAGTAVLGPLAASPGEIVPLLRRLGSGWSLERDPGDERLAALFSRAELAIAASGGSIWELAAFGVPTLAIAAAENQRQVLASLAAIGAAADAGPATSFDETEFAVTFDRWRKDREALARMRDLGPAMVDGHGPARVADIMLAFEDTGQALLRPADSADAYLLWRWANDAATRAQSFQQEPIPWDDHRRWLAGRLDSKSCRIFILVWKTIPVGVIRYDRIEEGTARISFAVDRDFRGRGFGLQLIEMSRAAAARDLAVDSFEADTLPGNAASQAVFRRAGFTEEPTGPAGRPRVRFLFHARPAEKLRR